LEFKFQCPLGGIKIELWGRPTVKITRWCPHQRELRCLLGEVKTEPPIAPVSRPSASFDPKGLQGSLRINRETYGQEHSLVGTPARTEKVRIEI
jgi:hypothetical protein